MNSIFKVNDELKVEILILNDCTCGEIGGAEETIEEILFDFLYENDLEDDGLSFFKGKLLYIDEMNEPLRMVEWDKIDDCDCGIFYDGKIYNLISFMI